MSRNMGNNSGRKAGSNSGRNVGRHSGRNLGRRKRVRIRAGTWAGTRARYLK